MTSSTSRLQATGLPPTVTTVVFSNLWLPFLHHTLFCCNDRLTLVNQKHNYCDLFALKIFINGFIPTQTAGGGEWLNKEMDYFYFYLPLLLSWRGDSKEKECRIAGERCQRQTFFLLLVNLTGKTPTCLHWRALSADSSLQ